MIFIILIIAFSITVINLINITRRKKDPQLRNQKRRNRLIEEIRLKEKQDNANKTKSDAD